MRSIPACSLVALGLVACQANVGVSGSISVPLDSAQQCADICHKIGTTLADIVVMSNNVGCVCEPRGSGAAPAAGQADSASPTARHAASAAGGLVAELIAEEEARQSQMAHH